MTDIDAKNFLSDEIKSLLTNENNPLHNKNDKNDLEIKTDFLKEGADYWSKYGSKYVTSFEKGEIISNYNSISEFDHLALFNAINKIFYETIREDLIKKEINIATIKDCFTVIEKSFKILSSQIQNEIASISQENVPSKNIDINLIISALHGFLSSHLKRKNS